MRKKDNFILYWQKIIAPFKGRIVIITILTLFSSLVKIIYPWLLKYLFDTLTKNGNLSFLLIFSVFLLILYLFLALVNFYHIYLFEYVAQKIMFYIRGDLFSKLQSLPLRFYEKRHTGEIMANMTSDITIIKDAMSGELKDLPVNLLSLVGAIGFMVYIYWPLALLIGILFPFILQGFKIVRRTIKDLTNHIQDKQAQLTAALEQSVSGIRVIKAYSSEEYEIARFDTYNLDNLKVQNDWAKLDALISVFHSSIGGLFVVIIILFGGLQVINGRVSIGALIAFLLYMFLVGNSSERILRGYINLCKGLAASKRVFLISNEESETGNSENLMIFPKVLGKIEFRGVEFQYEENKPTLNNISFVIEQGDITAIVGHTGAGKSTIIKLLFRFYNPDRGIINIDDHDIQKYSPASLRRQMAMALQEDILFDSTVSQNIAYGDNQFSLGKVKRAAKISNADNFIANLPKGYDTIIGERGLKLSAGQRQLISLARVAYREPEILVLDEAFSYLDSESERLANEAMLRIMRGKTIIIIAHRLSTIINAEKIIVVDCGCIVGIGKHQELISNNNVYKKLFKNQLYEMPSG